MAGKSSQPVLAAVRSKREQVYDIITSHFVGNLTVARSLEARLYFARTEEAMAEVFIAMSRQERALFLSQEVFKDDCDDLI